MSDFDLSVSIPASIAVFGVIVGIAAVFWYQLKKRRLAGWSRAKRRVESYEEIPNEDGGFIYNPIIVFLDAMGREIRFRVEAQWNRRMYEVGGEIPVLFCPSSSHRAVIDRWAELYVEVIVLCILAGFILFGAAGIAIFFQVTK